MWFKCNYRICIINFNGKFPVYCKLDRFHGFFGQNCNLNHCTDGIDVPSGHIFTIWFLKSFTDIAQAKCTIGSWCLSSIATTESWAVPSKNFLAYFQKVS